MKKLIATLIAGLFASAAFAQAPAPAASTRHLLPLRLKLLNQLKKLKKRRKRKKLLLKPQHPHLRQSNYCKLIT
jgi:hypothetical protein